MHCTSSFIIFTESVSVFLSDFNAWTISSPSSPRTTCARFHAGPSDLDPCLHSSSYNLTHSVKAHHRKWGNSDKMALVTSKVW